MSSWLNLLSLFGGDKEWTLSMNPPLPGKQLISFPLSLIVTELLRGYDNVELSPDVANILHMVCKNKHTCYIQFPNDPTNVLINNKPIDTPRLWDLEYWRRSSERWLKSKIKSDEEHRQSLIFKYNIHRTARALTISLCLQYDSALNVAFTMVRLKQTAKLKALDCPALVTRIEDVRWE